MLTERAECTLTEAFLRRRVESAELASYIVPSCDYEDLEDEGRTEVY